MADLFARDLTPATVLDALRARLGEQNGITARALVIEITHHESAADERRLRSIVEQLRSEGHRICAHPESGYFTAADDDELQRTLDFLYRRAATSLRQIAAMNRVSMPELRGQLGITYQPQGDRHEPSE